MTGPEHYREAERLLEGLTEASGRVPRADLVAGFDLAQVHATLALAAATAMGGPSMHPLDGDAWEEACGVKDPDDAPEATDG